MLLPAERLDDPRGVELPSAYSLRTFQPGDEVEFIRLMRAAGFEDWSRETLAGALSKALPEGVFLVVHAPTGAMAATAMATHNPTEDHPFGGELGWVACRPDHTGHGLGGVVCAAVIRRFAAAGYRRVYLRTDDWRLPAIKTYLKLGFVPFLHGADMAERWRAVCEKLTWKARVIEASDRPPVEEKGEG